MVRPQYPTHPYLLLFPLLTDADMKQYILSKLCNIYICFFVIFCFKVGDKVATVYLQPKNEQSKQKFCSEIKESKRL